MYPCLFSECFAASSLNCSCSVPSGVRNLKDLIRYTKEDPRESPHLYDTCRRFESALDSPALSSPKYLQAKELLDQSKSLICAELQAHGAQSIILMGDTLHMWSHAGWPLITVPLGFLSEDASLISCRIKTKTGQEVDCPFELWQSHPNR